MSITDELRKYTEEQIKWLDMTKVHYSKLFAIADRIDEKHKRAIGYVDDRDPETMAENGWVRLPKDADGEYIHLGDMMDGVDVHNTIRNVTGEVITISYDAMQDLHDSVSVAIREWSDDRKSYHTVYLDPNARPYHHHHEPTVEDVLREFGDWYAHTKGGCDEDGIIAEYAAKLQLKEVAE